MPTYTYECKVCGHRQDVFHGMSAKPRVKCEECHGATKKKVGIGSGVIFKGTGFYETDYKRKSGGGEGKSESGSKAESTAKGESAAKSESTTKGDNAAKSESKSKGESSSKGESASKSESSPSRSADKTRNRSSSTSGTPKSKRKSA